MDKVQEDEKGEEVIGGREDEDEDENCGRGGGPQV